MRRGFIYAFSLPGRRIARRQPQPNRDRPFSPQEGDDVPWETTASAASSWSWPLAWKDTRRRWWACIRSRRPRRTPPGYGRPGAEPWTLLRGRRGFKFNCFLGTIIIYSYSYPLSCPPCWTPCARGSHRCERPSPGSRTGSTDGMQGASAEVPGV